jgi:hypothetical protein
MSRINDALKRVSQNSQPAAAPPQIAPGRELRMLPTPQPVAGPSKPAGLRFFPVVVVSTIAAAAVAVGWTATHRPVRTIAAVAPEPAAAQNKTDAAATPTAAPMTTATAAPTAPAPKTLTTAISIEPKPEPLVNPPDAPKLQGICYLAGKSTAILDGKSVRAGDKYLQYRVKEINMYNITLVDASGKIIQLGIGN